MFGIDIKAAIEKNVREAAREFLEREEIITPFELPVVGYAHCADPRFGMLFAKDLCTHPKAVYRPGNTVVLHFIPYPREVVLANEKSPVPTEAWLRAFTESIRLSMRLNGAVREILDGAGRLSSCTGTPVDWNEDICSEGWSNRFAAYVAGMGVLGPAGSFHAALGETHTGLAAADDVPEMIAALRYGGRLGSIITDERYAAEPAAMDDDALAQEYRRLMDLCCWQPTEPCGDEMIAACPGQAISESGIDRFKCQAYCKTLDPAIPSPDLCGKCFRFRRPLGAAAQKGK